MEPLHHTLAILKDRIHNKDTAFSHEEREALGLDGRLPGKVETLDEQVHRMQEQFFKIEDPLMKWIYLNRVQETNETLFYAFVMRNLVACLPIVYTPTVGAACAQYCEIWQGRPRGLYLNRSHLGKVRKLLDNWPYDARIIVATDGTRILGLGDLGLGGHQICVGKLSLYTVGGGFAPENTLPISFDFGCSKEHIRDSPNYLGLPEPRVKEADFYNLVDETIKAVRDKWPRCVFQFEDFSNDTAFKLLAKHRGEGPIFNDDIQGTGCIAAAVVASAIRAQALRLGRPYSAKETKWVMLGAGAGGIGVAERIAVLLEKDGLTPEEARQHFYLVDSKGLITTDRYDYVEGTIAEHKKPWAQAGMSNADNKDLWTVVQHVKPTGLLGLSTIPNSFTPEMIQFIDSCHEGSPVVLALSNPTSKTEIKPQQAIDACPGVFYGSGSPFPASTLADGSKLNTAQANNLYVFPGIGLGAYICRAKEISDTMIIAVAESIGTLVTDEALSAGQLLPALTDIRHISATAAVALIRQAEAEGLCQEPMPADDAELLKLVESYQWQPEY